VLDSPAYRTALATRPHWSKANIARFKNMIRGGRAHHRSAAAPAAARRSASSGCVPPAARTNCAHCTGATRSRKARRIISMHLIENDPALSKPITDDPAAPNPGAGDWFVLIDATELAPCRRHAALFSGNAALKPLRSRAAIYRLMWISRRSDIC
jgi:hypothetical protein